MDWKALLVTSVASSVPIVNTYVRGQLLRRTLRTSIREIPLAMTTIDIQIVDRRGPSAVIHAQAESDLIEA